MKTKKQKREKRLADLKPGDEIVIDRGGHTAVVESNEPADWKAGYFSTKFDMGAGRLGGWTGNGDSMIRLAATVGGAR